MLLFVPEMNTLIYIVFSSFLLHKCIALNADTEDGKYSKDLLGIETDETGEVLSLAGIQTIDELITSEPVGCGNYVLQYAESVGFQSPNFPDKYPKDYKCTWRFTCPSEAAMEVKCDRFELEANHICFTDYLELFNNYKSLGKYCGKDSPTGLISNSNYMKATFHSNWDKITRAGFKCSVKCLDTHRQEIKLDLEKNSPPTFVPPVSCGSHIMEPDDSLIIRSKNFPKSYPKNQKCTWRFTCSSSNAEMRLHCDSFALQKTRGCNADYLQMFNSIHSLGKHCGKKGPKHLHSNSNYMKVNFRSNGDRITRTGFHCILRCKEKMDTTSITILKKFPELLTLNKEYASRNGDSLLEELAHDSKQFLSDKSDIVLPILEPNNNLETIINTFAESPKLDKVISYFEENEVDPELKWVPQIASKVQSSIAVECGSHIINPGDKLYFQSPNYPNKYPKKYECVWTFNCALENAIVELNCDDHFELQKNPICDTDYIETFDKSSSIRKNCGKDAPKALASNTNFMSVLFKTNWDKIRRAGFSCNVMCNSIITPTNYEEDISYSKENEVGPVLRKGDTLLEELAHDSQHFLSDKSDLVLPILEPNNNLETIINAFAESPKLDKVISYFEENEVGPELKWVPQIASKVQSSIAVECGSHMINPGDKLYFQSPNYPNKYPRKYECVWKFNCALENAIVELNCDDNFELQKNPICNTDYIETFDKSSSIRKNCGKDAPKTLTSNTNFMSVLFKTNWDKIRRAGFSCNVMCNVIVTPTNNEEDISYSEENEVGPVLKRIGELASKVHSSQVAKTVAVECGSHMMNPGDRLYFQSPNYPEKYPKNYKCVWKFDCAWENAIMELNCDDLFELQKNKICFTDYIETFDKSGSIKKNCGKDAPKALISNTNFMKVVFKTDWDKIRRAGFSCNVMCNGIATTTTKPVEGPFPTTTLLPPTTIKTQPPPTTNPPTTAAPITTKTSPNTTANIPSTTLSPALKCGKHKIEPSETVYFESANFPDRYKKNDTCRWRFTCSAMSSMIEVDCPDFDVEKDDDCAKDYLKIKDDNGKLGVFCGRDGPSNLISYTNQIKVDFVSDEDKKKPGFRCSVRCTYIETSSISTFGYSLNIIED